MSNPRSAEQRYFYTGLISQSRLCQSGFMNGITFSGSKWRCRLTVMDYTESPVRQWRSQPIRFSVQVLPATANKATAFSAGLQLYYGHSLSYAVVLIRDRIRRMPELPTSWNKYKALEAIKECAPFEESVRQQIDLGK